MSTNPATRCQWALDRGLGELRAGNTDKRGAMQIGIAWPNGHQRSIAKYNTHTSRPVAH